MSRKIISHYLTLAALVGTITGCSCVKVDEFNKLQSRADHISQTADEALNTANEARAVAQEADKRSKQTEEAMNRAFKKSMRK